MPGDAANASLASDVPISGQLSLALRDKLEAEDVLDLEVLLRNLGLRTLRALRLLEANERASLLVKAQALFLLLGKYTSNLRRALGILFDNCNYTSPLPPGAVGAAESAAARSNPAFVDPAWAEGSSSSSSSSSSSDAINRVGLGLVASVNIEMLPVLEDDTRLKKDLFESVAAVRGTIGEERYAMVVLHLNASADLVMAACAKTAEALAALNMDKVELQNQRDKKELLKAAKKSVRDVLLWRSVGSVLGMDSREGLVACFENACRYTNCDDNTVSQLTNGYRRIKEELAGGPAASRQQRGSALSPSRIRALGRQEPIVTPQPRGALVCSQEVFLAGWTSTPVAAQAMAQREIIDSAEVRSWSTSLAPGSRTVRIPAGLERTLPPQNSAGPQETDRVLKPHEMLTRSVSRPPESGLNLVALTLQEAIEPRSATLNMPNAQAKVAIVLAQALLKELESSNFELVQDVRELTLKLKASFG